MRPARVTLAAPLLAGLVVLAASGAEGQSFDGTYTGTIACPAFPGQTPLKTEFSLKVSGDSARYEREILRPGGGAARGAVRTGSWERGSGQVSPSGAVTLRGACEGAFSCEAEYQGELGASEITLAGTQRWRFRDRPETTRSCEIALRRP
jgi:hypothetical protein